MTNDEINYFVEQINPGSIEIKRFDKWVLYGNGDISWDPEDKDYWINTERLKTTRDLKDWVMHLRSKTWWNDIHESNLERITIESFKFRGILTNEILGQIVWATYLHD